MPVEECPEYIFMDLEMELFGKEEKREKGRQGEIGDDLGEYFDLLEVGTIYLFYFLFFCHIFHFEKVVLFLVFNQIHQLGLLQLEFDAQLDQQVTAEVTGHAQLD